MKSMGSKGWYAIVMVAILLGIGGGVILDRAVLDSLTVRSAPPAGAMPSCELVDEAWQQIEQHFVARSVLTETNFTYAAISGMADALGDTGHTRFLSPTERTQEQSSLSGQFAGIGVQVEIRDGQVVIIAPIDNSPAQHAGLQAGDVIQAINGQKLTDPTLDEVATMIRGPIGTKVTLTILTPSTGATRDVTLTRAEIQVNNVTWTRLADTSVAHVRIALFSANVTDDLIKAVKEVNSAGLSAIILDLRNDPGGLLDEAISTASQFLDSGNVLLTKDAGGNTTPVPVVAGGADVRGPMVVLINGGTASASEIVAGALQDHGRATLVGETTFGTGTVLREFPLSDGSALLLATEEWLTPNGRVIWKVGIAPDVRVALAADVAPLFPTAARNMSMAQLQARGDDQLLRALDLLTSGTVK